MTTPAATRQMIDSAYPLHNPPAADIILIYAGGDTVHPWTTAEIVAMPARYRWPCWVRSNPQQVNAGADVPMRGSARFRWAAAINLLIYGLFAAWLHGHKVPQGTCVILDLETAVDAAYVDVFNLALRAAGYKVTKYGSQNYIWQNPETDGGTYVALPGPDVLSTEGDTVATQYGFEGGFDRSIVKDQAAVPLWDTKAPPPGKGPFRHVADGTLSLTAVAVERKTTATAVAVTSLTHETPRHMAAFVAYLVGHGPSAKMPAGLVYWTSS